MNRIAGFGPVLVLIVGITLAYRTVAQAQEQFGQARDKRETIGQPSFSHDFIGDPIVISDCRITVAQRQEVPSPRDGILLEVCTELAPGQRPPPGRPALRRPGDRERAYYRLREGDAVEAGQIVALLDDRLARDELAIQNEKLAIAEKELAVAEHLREEARQRYAENVKPQEVAGVQVRSEDDLTKLKAAWYGAHYDAINKREDVATVRLRLRELQMTIATSEIRTRISGFIKTIHKNPGEAVRRLEPLVEVQDHRRLRIEGLADLQYLARLRPGMEVRVEPMERLAPERTFSGHLQPVTSIAVDKDPRTGPIISGSEDGTVRVWDPRGGEKRILTHPAPIRAVACTAPTAHTDLCIAGLDDGSAWIWDLDRMDQNPHRTLRGQHRGAVTGVAFSPDGRLCLTGGEDRAICLWETANGVLRYRFPEGHLGAITSLQFVTGSQVVSAGQDRTIRVWNLASQKASLLKTFADRSGDVAWLGARPDAVLFDEGDALQILGLPEGTGRGAFRGRPGDTGFRTCALFSPDGSLVATAGPPGGELRIWRAPRGTPTGTEIGQLVPPRRSTITCAAFSPDGSFVVTGTQEREVMMWRLPNRSAINRSYRGHLVLVERAADAAGKQARVWAEVENRDGELVPGNVATITVGAE